MREVRFKRRLLFSSRNVNNLSLSFLYSSFLFLSFSLTPWFLMCALCILLIWPTYYLHPDARAESSGIERRVSVVQYRARHVTSRWIIPTQGDRIVRLATNIFAARGCPYADSIRFTYQTLIRFSLINRDMLLLTFSLFISTFASCEFRKNIFWIEI